MALVEAARARRAAAPGRRLGARHPCRARRSPSASRRRTRASASFYDAVLVHGDPRLVRSSAPGRLSRKAAARPLHRLCRRGRRGRRRADDGQRSEIVVSGGSSAASLPLYRAALAAAAARDGARPGASSSAPAWRNRRSRLFAATAPAHARVERARPDFRALLARAAVSVSQAGYNTAVDLLRAGVAAVLVPFEAGRETEQRLRAEWLARARPRPAFCRKRSSRPGPSPNAVRTQLAGGAPPADRDQARRRRASRRPGRGSCAGRPRRPAVAPPAADWSPLDDVLRRTAGEGRTVAFWWRDDDAVALDPGARQAARGGARV